MEEAMSEDSSNFVFETVKNGPSIWDIEPNYRIVLYGKQNKEVVGVLDFNEDKLKFEGDAYESAQVFIDFVLRMFNQKIDQIKDEAALEGYKNGWKEAIEEYSEQFDPRED